MLQDGGTVTAGGMGSVALGSVGIARLGQQRCLCQGACLVAHVPVGEQWLGAQPASLAQGTLFLVPGSLTLGSLTLWGTAFHCPPDTPPAESPWASSPPRLRPPPRAAEMETLECGQLVCVSGH